MLSTMRGSLIVVLTLLLALVASVIPIPEALVLYRVQILALVLIYWCLALPEYVGVFTGLVFGLLLDTLAGTVLGQHAMSLSLIAYICLKTYKRIRLFPLWQQAIFVTLLLVFDRILMAWVDGSIGLAPKAHSYWVAPLLGGLLWPWLFIILRDLRRGFRVQ